MDTREQKGMELASTVILKHDGVYGFADRDHEMTTGTCSCPDWKSRHIKCKHMWALHHFLKQLQPTSAPANNDKLDTIRQYFEAHGNIEKLTVVYEKFDEQLIGKAIEQELLQKAGSIFVLVG